MSGALQIGEPLSEPGGRYLYRLRCVDELSAEELLGVMREMYTAEIARKGSPSPSPVYDSSVSELIAGILDRSSTGDHSVSATCGYWLKKGRQAARLGESGDSCRALTVIRRLCESGRLLEDSRLACLAQLNAAEAYLDYCCGDYQQASERLREAVECDSILETRFGYGIIFAHRLHLLNNLIRVKGLAGELPYALQLARDILSYLSGISDSVPAFWEGRFRDKLFSPVRAFSVSQLFSEVTLLLSITEFDAARTAGSTFFNDERLAEASAQWAPQLQGWFALKKLFYGGAATGYLRSCCRFVANGSREGSLLWHAAFMDASGVAEILFPPEGAQFRREVLAGFAQAPYVSKFFRRACSRVRSPWQERVN